MYQIYFYKKFTKMLLVGKVSNAGRNFLGRVCVQGRGNGKKFRYLKIDFYRRINSFGKILKILSKIYISGFLGLILYDNGLAGYILLSEGVNLNDIIYSGITANNTVLLNNKFLGWALPLKNITLFSVVNSIENKPYKGAIIARAAGVSSVLIGRTDKFSILKLNSGWQLKVSNLCMGSIGKVSNADYMYYIIKKAGTSRLMGFRPKVRGVAKNPCDHPHGGGNGKKSKPVNPVNAWSRVQKNRPTKNTQKDRLNRRFFKKF